MKLWREHIYGLPWLAARLRPGRPESEDCYGTHNQARVMPAMSALSVVMEQQSWQEYERNTGRRAWS